MCVSFRTLWSFHRWFYWASQLHNGGFGFYEEYNFSVCFSLFVSVALFCFKCNYSVTGLSCVWRSMNRCWFSGEGIQKMRAFRNALWFLKYSEVTKSQNKTFTSLGLNVRNPPIFHASEPFQRTLHACISFLRHTGGFRENKLVKWNFKDDNSIRFALFSMHGNISFETSCSKDRIWFR